MAEKINVFGEQIQTAWDALDDRARKALVVSVIKDCAVGLAKESLDDIFEAEAPKMVKKAVKDALENFGWKGPDGWKTNIGSEIGRLVREEVVRLVHQELQRHNTRVHVIFEEKK